MIKNRIKRFRKNDGVSFLEDVKGLSEDVKMFVTSMPLKLKNWMYEATIIIDALQKLDDVLQEGEPADKAIDFILGQIKGDADELLYESIKQALSDFVDRLNYLKEKFATDEIAEGSEKKEFATDVLIEVSKLSVLEADTVTQNAVYIYKS